MSRVTRDDCAALDRADPLARFRAEFDLPEGVIYLDGNSLGALPRATSARLDQVIRDEWGSDLIKSWNAHGWIDLALKVGDKIARLIGAQSGEVVVTDSTSINLFKLLAAGLRLRPGRRVILSERDNFPTDLYMIQGLCEMLGGGHELRLVERGGVAGAIDADTAIVTLTQVDYRSGELHDMAAITKAAHDAGALMLWDLCHSAGALPVDLNAAKADFAVGCGYKYLNGGPGAPAFLFVAARHHDAFAQPLTGWMGHAEPFAFGPRYRPAAGIRRALTGTPPILSLAALEIGVDGLIAGDMTALRLKSMALTDLFIRLVEQECADCGLALVSPLAAAQRGSQVSFRHAEGYAVMQALIARGIIGDFRAPDVMRFGFAPLYLRHMDAWDAVAALSDVLASRAWDRAEFRRRAAVT
ncbi:MAG: kynureninase [Proteobacteria bacterium]|nr:kynureninase [Pseudomonadota bacterium]